MDNNNETQAIKQAILDYYHEGHAQYSPDLYAKILHPEWKFFLIEDEELRVVDREEFYSWYAPERLKPDLKWETSFTLLILAVIWFR